MKKILIGVFTLFAINACDTDALIDLNVNPQAVNQVDLNFLMSSAQLGTASGGSRGDNRYIDWRTNMGMCAHAIQQIANVGGGIAPGDKYTDNSETNTAPWEFLYNDVLQNLAEIIRQTDAGGYAEGKNKNLRQAARILKAYNFMRLTDYYGNIPYSESLKGVSDLIFFPKYDSQQAIYTDLLKEVSEATQAINTSNGDEDFSEADLFYNGDIAKWKKFGNTLLLRMALRVSNVDANLASQYATLAVNGGLMTSNEDICKIQMDLGPSEWTNQNGISRAFTQGDGGQPSPLSATLVDFLKNHNDPRLSILSGGVNGNTDPAAQRGLPNGLDNGGLQDLLGKAGANVLEEFSVINPKLLDDDESYVFMNYSEAEFLLAECAEKGIGGVTGAEEHFRNGVFAALRQYADAYKLADGSTDQSLVIPSQEARNFADGLAYDGMKSIYEQMWVSKFFNWWDAWSDWRRTGYPVLTPVNYPGNVTGGTIPRKLRVPNGELAINGDNFTAGGSTPNQYTTKVWWDGGN